MMFFKTIKYLICLMVIGFALYAQTPLSLSDATTLTLAQNRDVLAAKLARQDKENEALAARTRRWPTLSASGQVGPLLNRPSIIFTEGLLGNYPGTGPIPATNTEVTIPRRISGYTTVQASLPLTQQWRLGLGVKQARDDASAAEQEEAQIRQNAVARVRSLYFQIGALEAARKVAKLQLETADEVARLAKEGLDKGTALPADEARVAARLVQAKADAANIDADFEDANEQLNLLMGEALDARFALTAPDAERVTVSAAEARTQALAARPELREARIRLEQANLSVRSKKLEQIPDVSLVVSDIYLLNTSNYLPSQFATASLSLSWEAWDWGRKQHEAAALRSKEAQQKLAVAQLEQQVQFEADRAWREYERERRNWEASQTATRSAEEQMRVAKERYTKQAALLRDLLEAQTNWEAAGQAEARTRAAVGTAWANLQAAMGNE